MRRTLRSSQRSGTRRERQSAAKTCVCLDRPSHSALPEIVFATTQVIAALKEVLAPMDELYFELDPTAEAALAEPKQYTY